MLICLTSWILPLRDLSSFRGNLFASWWSWYSTLYKVVITLRVRVAFSEILLFLSHKIFVNKTTTDLITHSMHQVIPVVYLLFVNILTGFAQQVEVTSPSMALSITTFFGANCDDRLQSSNIYPLNTCAPLPDNPGVYQKVDCADGSSAYSTTLCSDSQCNNCDAPFSTSLACITSPSNQSTLYACPSLPDSFVNHTIAIAQYSSSNCDASSQMLLQYVSPSPTCINNKSTNNGTAVSSYYTCDENGVVARNCDERNCKGNCVTSNLPLNQCSNGTAYDCIIQIPAPSSGTTLWKMSSVFVIILLFL